MSRILYFFTVKEGERVRYEGANAATALRKFDELREWVIRNSKVVQVTFIVRPFEERELGGQPQVINPGE